MKIQRTNDNFSSLFSTSWKNSSGVQFNGLYANLITDSVTIRAVATLLTVSLNNFTKMKCGVWCHMEIAGSLAG